VTHDEAVAIAEKREAERIAKEEAERASRRSFRDQWRNFGGLVYLLKEHPVSAAVEVLKTREFEQEISSPIWRTLGKKELTQAAELLTEIASAL